jgi:hypothetical protein
MSVQRMLSVNMDEKINQNKRRAKQTRHTLTPAAVSSSTALLQSREVGGEGRGGEGRGGQW